MIDQADIINQPYSGDYDERIYDNESAWNSQSWTWVKFTNEDLSEWCGQFRGFPRQTAVSKKHDAVLILTADYLFQLDRKTGDLIKLEDQPQYQNLTVTPDGDFIIADYYHVEKITNDINSKSAIKSPIEMDMIEFKKWSDGKMEFTCDEFMNWDRHLIMEYDSEKEAIKIKNAT